jgi:hypothetical protein
MKSIDHLLFLTVLLLSWLWWLKWLGGSLGA